MLISCGVYVLVYIFACFGICFGHDWKSILINNRPVIWSIIFFK
jgi:hypothetical protein